MVYLFFIHPDEMFEGIVREDVSVFLGWVSIACWIPVTVPELLGMCTASRGGARGGSLLS